MVWYLVVWWLWNYNDAEVSWCLQAGSIGWLWSRGIGWRWRSIGWFFGSHVVVVPVVLSVTLVSVMPLELNVLTRSVRSGQVSGNNCSPWLWKCGPSVRDIPLCYGLGCPSCSPTRRCEGRGRLCIGNNCLQRSSHQLRVWGWANLRARGRGRQGRRMDSWRLRLPGRRMGPKQMMSG